MFVVDRFERLRSWGEPSGVYAIRGIYMGEVVVTAVRNTEIYDGF